jgi:ABC-2 type transport system permease protein
MANPWYPKLVAVVRREYMERVRTRWFLVATLLGPLFMAAITVLPAWLAIRSRASTDVTNVVIIDATGAGLGDRVADALRDTTAGVRAARPVVVQVPAAGVAAAESTATAAVMRKERRGYLVLDSASLAGNSARYAGRNAASIADVERVRDAVRRQVTAFRLEREAGISAQRATELTSSRIRISAERITDKGRGGSDSGNIIFGFVVAFLLYMLIILYGQNVLRGVMEEKTTRVAEVVVSSVRPEILMAGKVVGVGAVALTQLVLWAAGSMYLSQFTAPLLRRAAQASGGAAAAGAAGAAAPSIGMPDLSFSTLGTYILFFLLGYLLYSALFAAIGAMVNSEQEAQQAAFPVMLPLIASAVFIQVVVTNPEATGAKVMSRFPLTAPILMPLRMGLTSVPPLEVAAVLAGIAVTVVAAIWVAARIYRVGLLMYGKRPTLPELARWVRHG